jgi:hypothetical protein
MLWFMMDRNTPVCMSLNRQYAYRGETDGWHPVDADEILRDMHSPQISERMAFIACRASGISWDLIPIQVLSKHY